MSHTEDRLLPLLERLFAIAPSQLDLMLSECAELIGGVVAAEKVDAFVYDAASNSLVALGTSRTELAQLQKNLGLHRLPLVNGDPMARVFETGETYHNGATEQDPRQPRGVIENMAVRSMLAVPLDVGGARRGVLSLASTRPDAFGPQDVSLLKVVSNWVGGLVHRLELTEAFAQRASEQARRDTAEELVTVLAHDLRNLLSPISGRLELLYARAETEQRARDIQDFDRIRSGLKRLAELMSDLLDVSRIERGILNVQSAPLDLVKLVRASAVSMTLPDVEIEVEPLTPEILVEGDALRLRQALENILSNATKHSPRGGAVKVQLEPTKIDSGAVAKIIVVDRGSGIAPDVLPRIFDRYVSAGRSAGLGLGLYLAKAVISAHGGSITVTSSSVGTRCELLLPMIAGDSV
jgi:two-component system OmpR family sensor kinase